MIFSLLKYTPHTAQKSLAEKRETFATFIHKNLGIEQNTWNCRKCQKNAQNRRLKSLFRLRGSHRLNTIIEVSVHMSVVQLVDVVVVEYVVAGTNPIADSKSRSFVLVL